MDIKVLMLGTGTPRLRPHRCGSSSLITVGGDRILIDCGYGSVRRMAENNVNLHDVQRLFFTHHHYDHNVDYPSLVMHGRSGRETPLDVYGPIGTEKLSSDLFQTGGFTIDLNNRLSRDIVRGNILSGVQDIDAGFTLEGDTWKLTAQRADHFTVGGNFTLCYRIDTDQGSVVFSGDTIPCDGIRELAKGADVLVHEVYWQPDGGRDGRRPFAKEDASDAMYEASRRTKHSLPEEVKTIAYEAGVKRLVLTHLFTDEHLDELHGYMQQGVECEVTLAEDHMRFQVG